MLPKMTFRTTTGGLVTTHPFGNCDAGSYTPGSSGWEVRIYNDYAGDGSEDATSVKINARGSCGQTDEVWCEQHWVEVKSYGYSTGSTGMVDDAMATFQPVGTDMPLGIRDITSEGYRTLFFRVNSPTDAEEQDIALQLVCTYQNPQSAITKWITGLRGNGIVASTGDPFAMSTTGATDPIPYEAGYALIDNNEIYYGSSGSYTITTTTGTGAFKIYLDESGAFNEKSSGESLDSNELLLYEATYSTGVCTALIDKRVYLAGLQSGTTGAMPTIPDLGDLYFGTNGKVYGAETAGSWTVIVPGATFLSLTDTPDDYTSKAGNLVKVTTGADALEFTTDFTDYADSAMVISGGELSAGTSGATLKVAALTAALRESSGATAILKYKTLSEQDNQALAAANTSYYVLLTYTTGDPTVSLSESQGNGNNEIGIGRVRKTTGDEVHYHSAGRRLQDGVGELHKRASSLREIELEGGCTLSYAGTDNLAIASGIVYGGINRFTPSTFSTTGTDVFTYVGRASTGADDWFYTTGATTIDHEHFDNQTTGLNSITVGQYGCHWVYLHPDDEDVYVIYGRDTYKLAEAEVAEAPNVPDIISDFGLLLGCIIVPQAGGSFTTVQMVTDTFFTGTAVATHNDLGGLDSGDYQHLTSAEHDEITPWLSSVTLSTGGTINIPTGQEYQINGTEVKLDEWATPTTGTALNSSTGRHGLLPQLGGGTVDYLRADGTWVTPPGATGGEANTASNVNTTGVGVYEGKVGVDLQFKGIHSTGDISVTDSTGTHTINLDVISTGIKLDDLGTPDDNTDLNATTGLHGLLPKFSGTTGEYLSATGGWGVPSDTDTDTFLGLTDTPADFADDASKLLRVDSSSGAVEFVSSTGLLLDNFGDAEDNTDLDATTGHHGLLLKLTGSTSTYLNADGAWSTPPDTGEVNTASNAGTTGIGIYYTKSTYDLQFKAIHSTGNILVTDSTGTHTVNLDVNSTGILLDNLGTPEDNTDLNATTGYHGLLPKRDGNNAHWLDGSGAWSAPTAAEVEALYSSGAFTAGRLTEISTTGVIKESPFAVTTGDVFNFGAHSAGFTEQAIATTTGTAAINWNNGIKALFTRSTGSNGAVTFSFTAPPKSVNLQLTIRGSTAGSTGTVTWPTVYWQDGSAPTLTGTASAIDVVSFSYSTGLTAYLGLGSANFSTG